MTDNPLFSSGAPPIHAIVFPVRVETVPGWDRDQHRIVDRRGAVICHGRALEQLEHAARLMNQTIMEL